MTMPKPRSLIVRTEAKREAPFAGDGQTTGDGHLNGPAGSAPTSRDSYGASYPDAIGRLRHPDLPPDHGGFADKGEETQ